MSRAVSFHSRRQPTLSTDPQLGAAVRRSALSSIAVAMREWQHSGSSAFPFLHMLMEVAKIGNPPTFCTCQDVTLERSQPYEGFGGAQYTE